MRGTPSPLRGGISLDLGFTSGILEVLPEDFVATAEPGVTHGQLNARFGKHGLFLPIDPGWDASLGGMTAPNYVEQVLGLETMRAGGRP